MFHEVQFPWLRGQSLKHRLLAIVTKWMAKQVGSSANRCFVSTPAWETLLQKLYILGPIQWLPIPTNLPFNLALPSRQTDAARPLRIGHFGTYGPLTNSEIKKIVLAVDQSSISSEIVLLGRGSERFCHRLIAEHPTFQARIRTLDGLEAAATADEISRCDLMIQWYPDGISSRRTSTMASIALGIPWSAIAARPPNRSGRNLMP